MPDQMIECETCGKPFVLQRKMSGTFWLPTCDCQEKETEARLERLIEAKKRRELESVSTDDITVRPIYDAMLVEIMKRALERMNLPSMGHVMVKMGRLEVDVEDLRKQVEARTEERDHYRIALEWVLHVCMTATRQNIHDTVTEALVPLVGETR